MLAHMRLRGACHFQQALPVGELTGDLEGDADSCVLVFRARVGDKLIHGVDMLQFDNEGRIATFTVRFAPEQEALLFDEFPSPGTILT